MSNQIDAVWRRGNAAVVSSVAASPKHLGRIVSRARVKLLGKGDAATLSHQQANLLKLKSCYNTYASS